MIKMAPIYKCRECGYKGKDFKTIKYDSEYIEYDVECPKCGSTEADEK